MTREPNTLPTGGKPAVTAPDTSAMIKRGGKRVVRAVTGAPPKEVRQCNPGRATCYTFMKLGSHIVYLRLYFLILRYRVIRDQFNWAAAWLLFHLVWVRAASNCSFSVATVCKGCNKQRRT